MIRHFQRFVVFGAAILFIAYAMATDDTETAERPKPDADSDDSDDEAFGNVVDTATEAGRFGTWSLAVKQAGLVTKLEGDGPFTLFAPTDDAFAALGETLDELLADKRRLAGVLRRHIVAGKHVATDLQDGSELKTLAKTTLSVKVTGDSISVGDSPIDEPDLTASNGVIHGIAKVLLPANGRPDETE